MPIPVLDYISILWKPRARPIKGRQNLMLAGINQTVFLNQWGEPETQIGLNRIGSSYKLGSLFLIADPDEEVHYSVWIYKKRDRILFFSEKRLISHFKWSELKEKWKRPKEKMDTILIDKPSTFITSTLALVA